jgi:beta-glucosidase
MRLGVYDPPDRVPWSQLKVEDVVDSPAHRQLALEAARESMVLLKNDGTLPLSKDLETIAVIGPNADQWLMLLGNYNGVPSDIVTPLRGIREAVGSDTKVLFAQGSEPAEGMPLYDLVPGDVLFTTWGDAGIHASYYGSASLEGDPVFAAVEATLDANWHDGAPRNDMNDDDFGVTWQGVLIPKVTGSYRLGVIATTRFELYLDGEEVARSRYNYRDELGDPRLVRSEALELEAGRHYTIRLDAHETYSDAQVQLLWAPPRGDLETEAVEIASQADAVILTLGLTSRLEGEEMRVEIEGFSGGDRTRIDLPDVQQRLMKRITDLGKPTVLVLLNGSALAVKWADENVPAILEAWYPGQAAGTAIADVIFGDYNPGGRLPVTFYQSVDDLPPFEEYAMTGHTYRFFDGEPLYPFGHGLSYTTFEYANLQVESEKVSSDGQIRVSVDVTNTGPMPGDEVVQLYVRYSNSKVARPRKELKGFERITLDPGQTIRVEFAVPTRELAYWDIETDGWVVESGPVEMLAGSSSEDIRLTAQVTIDG